MSEDGVDPHSCLLKFQLLLMLLTAANGQRSGSDDPEQDLGPGTMVREADTKDVAVVENCADAREIFASYLEECRNVETVEFGSDTPSSVEEAERRVILTGSQWRGKLRQVGSSSACTPSGVLAKARLLEGYFVEYPTHDEIMGVMRSILRDLEGLVQKLSPETG